VVARQAGGFGVEFLGEDFSLTVPSRPDAEGAGIDEGEARSGGSQHIANASLVDHQVCEGDHTVLRADEEYEKAD
jgi:hypothetical protein